MYWVFTSLILSLILSLLAGTVQKLKDEMEKDKERAVMQKKIGSLIKKEVWLPLIADS